MCNAACIEFGKSRLARGDVQNKKIIEVGSRNINGSLRTGIEALGAASYLGVDVSEGPGVDEICDITKLDSRYGPESFDVVISTELLEHVRDWRKAMSNLKRILRPNGVLLLTTRSKGFPYHGYLYDFWRYEVDDMKAIFSDLSVEVIERDPLSPGVFVRATKPATFSERSLDAIDLYSIVTGRRCRDVTGLEVAVRRLRHKARLFLWRVRDLGRPASARPNTPTDTPMRYPSTWLQPRWWAARRIKRFLTKLRGSSGTVLHLGAGGKRLAGAINCDLYDPSADRQWDAISLPEVPTASVDIVEHHHLIEHLGVADLERALAEWARVLKPNGVLVVSAPDLEAVLAHWLEASESERWGYGIKMIYGSQEHEGMFHKNGFTPRRLADVLKPFGLTQEWHYRGYPRRPTPSFIAIARKRS